jgi:hypothetical protein
MRLTTTDPLFPWHKLDDCPSLALVRRFLDQLPDGPLLAALRARRGRGRNDYPVHVLWRIHLARYLLRHPSMQACLDEVERNPALRQVVGLKPADAVPEAWNLSRFQEVLGRPEHQGLQRQMFEELAGRLAEAVPDLGVNVAGDWAALSARRDAAGKAAAARDADADKGTAKGPRKGKRASRGQASAGDTSGAGGETAGAGQAASGGLPQPDGGRKQYEDEQGRVTQVYEWQGYKFHLLVDVKHEVILAWRVTAASASDAGVIPQLLEDAQRVLPQGRMRTLAYDRAADDVKTHELLHRAGIKPLIQNRSLWKDELERRLPGHPRKGQSNVVYDEAGTLYCYDTVSDPPVKHPMAYLGHEAQAGTLKYRCPARHEKWSCPSDGQCNGQGCRTYGKTVRVRCSGAPEDLRRFPAIPRGTQQFERCYKGRTACERVNARIKLFWGADDGNVTGPARFHAHIAAIMLVHIGLANLLAMADRYEGKSLSPVRLSLIARRLRAAAGVT